MADYTFTTGPNFCAQYPTDPTCNAYGGATGSKTLQNMWANAAANAGTWMPANGGIVPPGFPGTVPTTTTTTPGSTPGQVVNVVEAAKPWYKTWWGVGLIAVGGIAIASKLMKPKAA